MTGCSGGDDLQSGRFRDEVVAVLRSDYPEWRVDLVPDDPAAFRVDALLIYVGNLHVVIAGMEPARRRVEIVKFLDVVDSRRREAAKAARGGGDDESFDSAKSRLRIQLVPTEYSETATDILIRPFSKELSVGYALDRPDSYEALTRKKQARWAIDVSAIEAAAIANLEEASRSLQPEIRTGRGGGFAIVSSGDSYDGARLLLPAFMERLRGALGPSLVMAVPRRDFLIGWTPDYGGGKALLTEVGNEMARGPYPRSRELFLSSASGLRPLEPSERAAYE